MSLRFHSILVTIILFSVFTGILSSSVSLGNTSDTSSHLANSISSLNSSPSPPQNLTGYAGNHQVNITWLAPANDGGTTITAYYIYSSTTSGSGYTLKTIISANTLYDIETSLTNGITYYFVVQAYNGANSANSNEIALTPFSPPSAPQNLQAQAGVNQIYLNWTSPSSNGGGNITDYNVYRSLTNGSGYTLIGSTLNLNYTNSIPLGGTYYYFVVSAVNGAGESAYSNVINSTSYSVPSYPLSVKATSGNETIILSWSIPISNGGYPINNYSIYRSLSSGSGYNLIGITTQLNFIDTGLTNGVTYYYVIRANNILGASNASSEVNMFPTTVPSAPQNLQIKFGNDQLILTWSTPNLNGGLPIANYTIYRSTSATSNFTHIGSSTSLTYTDSGVTVRVTYYYFIRAFNSLGEGSNSTIISATPATVPSPPENVTASEGDTEIFLDWTPPLDDGGSPITNYTIYRSADNGISFKLVGTTTLLNYTDTGLTNGYFYDYIVYANNKIGVSSYIWEISIAPFGQSSSTTTTTTTTATTSSKTTSSFSSGTSTSKSSSSSSSSPSSSQSTQKSESSTNNFFSKTSMVITSPVNIFGMLLGLAFIMIIRRMKIKNN